MTDIRLTEAGDTRVTEAADTRVTEDPITAFFLNAESGVYTVAGSALVDIQGALLVAESGNYSSIGSNILFFTPFEAFIRDGRAAGQYLVEITAFRGADARAGGLATLAEIPLATVPPGGGVFVGDEVPLRYADRHWVGAPDDAVHPNVYYEGRIATPLIMERMMPLLPEEDRRVQRQFGAIELANGDGGLDSIVNAFAVDGRQVRVLFGRYFGPYDEFGVIANVLGTGWEAEDLVVRLGVKGRNFALDLQMQTNLYAGTGGAEGTEEIRGKPKPLVYGRTRNITPALIDPTNLIYQVHDGSMLAVDAVYDRGAALTDSTDDVASYAALVALSVSAGEFATALEAGLFKLGSSPDGLITCDVRGDAEPDSPPDYLDRVDEVALRIMQTKGGLSSALIDTQSFTDAASGTGEMGIYISKDDTPSTSDVLSILMACIGGWWGAGRDGLIRAGALQRPLLQVPELFLNTVNVVRLEPEETPIPRWLQRVGYRRNWTPQRGEDLAAAVTAERRQFLTEEFRIVTSADSDVRIRHRQALAPDMLPTLFEDDTDAADLATHLLTLHSADRRIFRATVKRIGYLVDLGSYVNLTWPRLGLESGRNFAVIGIREDADEDTVTLRLWG